MAIVENFPFGGIRGKIGNLVYYKVGNKINVRKAPKPRSTPPTEKQLLQQHKFKLVSQFLAPLRPFITTYGHAPKPKRPMPYIMSRALRWGLEEVDGVPQLCFSNLQLIMGDFLGITLDHFAVLEGQKMILEWNVKHLFKQPTYLSVVAYAPHLKEFQILPDLVPYEKQQVVLEFPSTWATYSLELWIIWTCPTKYSCSTSLYVGSFTLD